MAKCSEELLQEQTSTQLPTTGPNHKDAMETHDNVKPAFTLEDHVLVAVDTLPGMNRPKGCGFVKKV